MAVITAQQVIDKAETILQDVTNVRWPATELLGWLNDGQREIVLLKPDAYTRSVATALIAGTKQSIPSDGIRLIEVVRNAGTAGATPGDVIRSIDGKILNDQVPGWHAVTGAVPTQHFIYDERDPKRFYVYPPQPTPPQFVELVYSASPIDIVIGAVLTIDDVFGNALLDYILFRAYSKDAEYAGRIELAQKHYGLFVQSLGMKSQSDRTISAKPMSPR